MSSIKLQGNASGAGTQTLQASATAGTPIITLPDATGTLLVSGGDLGTPSAGTVTNLTGTASININGTVGATTPTTGVFTTAKAIAASTQDSVTLQGRAGGTSSYGVTLTPATLTASQTLTLPNSTATLGYLNAPPVGTKTASYTLAVGDVGKYVQLGASGAIVIPTSVFSDGDLISIYNNTASTATITCSAPTAYIAGSNTTVTSVTLAIRGVCTVLFSSSTTCVLTGNVS